MGESVANPKPLASLLARIGAGHPLTGQGLAAFARAGIGRVLLFQAAFAVAGALTVVWCFQVTWLPVLERAMISLPDSGAEIRSGHLRWVNREAVLLASSPYLALAVDPEAASQLGQNADIQLELRPSEFRFRGLLGQTLAAYPSTLLLPLDRTGATAAWGAWRMPILVLTGLGTGLGLLVAGGLLAALYAPILVLAGWLMRHPVSLTGAWKLGLASLLPGSLIMDLGLFLYARSWMGLVSLTAFFGLHFLVGWLAAFWGLSCMEKENSPSPADNPFGKGTGPRRPTPASNAPNQSNQPNHPDS